MEKRTFKNFIAYVEAKIDFPEEDLPKNIIKEIQKTSNKMY